LTQTATHSQQLTGRVKIQDASLKRLPWKYRATVRKIREFEEHLTALSEKALKQYFEKLRSDVREGREQEMLDKQLPAVFACVCVTARRTLGMRPYHVQLIGGMELHRGRIAEMATGEGKTLVATMPATITPTLRPRLR
jgi:preprotein translocase subunit SecA